MSEELQDIPAPAAPLVAPSAGQVLHGPPIPPIQRIILYSATEWEDFIEEWAHFSLKPRYLQVQRFSGAGDRGIDIAGFTDPQKLRGVWDNYQCKHYDHPIRPTEMYPEIAKVLWYSFTNEYRVPRRYVLVSPRGVGPALAGLLGDAGKLKEALIENWDRHCRQRITEKQDVLLVGSFLEYVNAFDFSVFEAKTGLQIIDDHRACPYYANRFGGGLPARPAADSPPEEIAPSESHYVAQLLEAYGDHKKVPAPDLQGLGAWPSLKGHFKRQREAFDHAESLRVFARDTVPPGTFESLQGDIYDGVIDTHDADHPDGYTRLRMVTKAAQQLQLTANALLTETK